MKLSSGIFFFSHPVEQNFSNFSQDLFFSFFPMFVLVLQLCLQDSHFAVNCSRVLDLCSQPQAVPFLCLCEPGLRCDPFLLSRWAPASSSMKLSSGIFFFFFLFLGGGLSHPVEQN